MIYAKLCILHVPKKNPQSMSDQRLFSDNFSRSNLLVRKLLLTTVVHYYIRLFEIKKKKKIIAHELTLILSYLDTQQLKTIVFFLQ